MNPFEAPSSLATLLYPELRALAAAQLARETPGHTLQATALANEAYIKLSEQSRASFVDERHFLAIAATVIRRILVDAARAKKAAKRGGARQRIELGETLAVAPDRLADLADLEDALALLEGHDARKAKVVELRYYGGMDVPSVAAHLGVSEKTVVNEWRFAKSWLQEQLRR